MAKSDEGSNLCPHGVDGQEDVCMECDHLESDEGSVKELGVSDRWALGRRLSKKVANTVYDYCSQRGIQCKEHNSHGLYFDVWAAGQKFMFDCSPEDEKRPYPDGLVVIRDESHHYERPTRVGAVNILTEGGQVLLDTLLGVQPA